MTLSRRRENPGQFRKGRSKTGGRRRGTPNRATRAVKEFLSEILDSADVQDAIEQRILKGDTTAFFKALEMVHGKPRQAVELAQDGPTELVVRWQD
jgi:hypothetical protein